MIAKTLFGKLLLLFLAFGALMAGVFLYIMNVSHETYHLELDQTANRTLAEQYVARRLLSDAPLTGQTLPSALRHISEVNPAVDVYVLNAQGDVLAGSVAASSLVRRRIDPTAIRQFLEEHPKFPLLGDSPTDARDRTVFSAARLSVAGSSAAYLYVVLHREERAAGTAGLKKLYAIHDGIGVALATVVLAVAASLLFLHGLAHRLGVLHHDIECFRDSQFADVPAALLQTEPRAADEIDRLRRLFIELAARIHSQMQELYKTDEMRRELLAHVSHDLRTPLATLSAHLETLTLKDDLPAPERKTYTDVALAQSRRLSKLIEQLLELAKLDAGQIPFAPEPFQIADLAHDVAQKFELAAKRASVMLKVEHSGSVPLVVGDIRLIENVFDNLLENALRHANAGGRATIRLLPQRNTVRVEVCDSGPGIPTSERHRVFERFYRGDKSRSTQSGHAGLGLAIVRGILELHGRTIDFVSTPNEGTSFFFELVYRGPQTSG